jgi:hypothetical protein
MLAAIPEGLIFEEAAPGSEGSHYALSSVRAAKVRRGRDVLVYGATGAIGSAAVQLLKQVGATSRLPARLATRVPYRRVNHGTERVTTVTAIQPLSWPRHALPGRTHPANMPDKDEAAGSSPARPTTSALSCENSPAVLSVVAHVSHPGCPTGVHSGLRPHPCEFLRAWRGLPLWPAVRSAVFRPGY